MNKDEENRPNIAQIKRKYRNVVTDDCNLIDNRSHLKVGRQNHFSLQVFGPLLFYSRRPVSEAVEFGVNK